MYENIRILKAKIDKDNHVLVSYERTEIDGTITPISEPRSHRAHNDLKNAFAALIPHFAALSFHGPAKFKDIKLPPTELIKNFAVSSVTMGDKDGAEWAMLTGNYECFDGKKFTFTTPLRAIEGSEEKRYKFADELSEVLQDLDKELKKYLFEHKFVDEQGDLFKQPAEAPEMQGNTYPGGLGEASPEAQERVKADPTPQRKLTPSPRASNT